MAESSIEWTDRTWNPVVGCTAVSPGCDHCYAATVAHRGLTEQHRGLTVRSEGATKWTGEVRTVRNRLLEPLAIRRPSRFFVSSMSDLFHPGVPNEWIGSVWDVMALAKQHTFQVLTKRPKRMAQLLSAWQNDDWTFRRDDLLWCGPLDGPLPNVWLGTSVESADYLWRIDALREAPAALRFLSIEPLLGPLPELNLEGIGWVIVGGESGPGARPMHPHWVWQVIDACQQHGVPFFFKQWGAWSPYWPEKGNRRHQRHVMAVDGTLYEPGSLNYPDGPRVAEARQKNHGRDGALTAMYRHGVKGGGRLLYDRTWDEMPRVTPREVHHAG